MYYNISLNCSSNPLFYTKAVERINTHFIVNHFFPPKIVPFIRKCGRNTKCIPEFPMKNGYTKAPQYLGTRTLPILFTFRNIHLEIGKMLTRDTTSSLKKLMTLGKAWHVTWSPTFLRNLLPASSGMKIYALRVPWRWGSRVQAQRN
jgi:hypothetical protein